MRRIHALGLGLAGVVALVACGDDGGTGGGGTGASGTGGSTSSSTTSSSSASSGGAGQGGAAQGGGGAAQGGGGAAQGGGGAGGGAAASVWAHAASGAGEEAVYEVETAADGGVLVLGSTPGDGRPRRCWVPVPRQGWGPGRPTPNQAVAVLIRVSPTPGCCCSWWEPPATGSGRPSLTTLRPAPHSASDVARRAERTGDRPGPLRWVNSHRRHTAGMVRDDGHPHDRSAMAGRCVDLPAR